MASLTQELEWGQRSNMEKKIINTPELEGLKQEDFVLVQENQNSKIHDTKFETKATTFAKDAFKRFCKNKSSIVAAIIIGILLLGSIFSFLSPYDIRGIYVDQQFLAPKLFETGTGFWDGTVEYKGIGYDSETESPAGFKPEAVVGMTFDNENVEYIDSYYRYAKGGDLRVTCKKTVPAGAKQENYVFFMYNNDAFELTSTNDLKAVFDFNDTADCSPEGDLCDGIRIRLMCGNVKNPQYYEVLDWTNEYKTYEFNLSDFIKEKGIDKVEQCRIRIEGKPTYNTGKYSYFLLHQLLLTSNDESQAELLADVEINDANHTAGLGPDESMHYPQGYWKSSALMNVYHAEKRSISFRYDTYAAIYGLKEFVIGGSIMEEYIANGWCEFKNFKDPSTFKVLDEEKCPVVSVLSSSYDSAYKIWQFNTETIYYKYLGYDKVPCYLFGTDAQGRDLLTVALSSLKTSLLVAIISTAVTLTFGLIWGSISGYFGGTVDLLMERFTDILGGIPWIVMMTLIILLLGNNIITFAFALCMTGWIGKASMTRTQFYRFKGREYVLAARTLGASDMRLIFKHILPNGLGTIVTSSVLSIPGCIFSEASIAYLGLGLKGVDSFGVMLSNNQQYIDSHPLLIVVPAIIISLLMISFNLFGNGLRDALNPTLKGGEQ